MVKTLQHIVAVKMDLACQPLSRLQSVRCGEPKAWSGVQLVAWSPAGKGSCSVVRLAGLGPHCSQTLPAELQRA